MTLIEIMRLPEYQGRHVCDFRLDHALEHWEVYGGGGVWMTTEHVWSDGVHEQEEES